MLSFNPQNQPELVKTGAAQNLRDVSATSRVDKVIRIALSALRNCLKHVGLSGEIVEKGTLEAQVETREQKAHGGGGPGCVGWSCAFLLG